MDYPRQTQERNPPAFRNDFPPQPASRAQIPTPQHQPVQFVHNFYPNKPVNFQENSNYNQNISSSQENTSKLFKPVPQPQTRTENNFSQPDIADIRNKEYTQQLMINMKPAMHTSNNSIGACNTTMSSNPVKWQLTQNVPVASAGVSNHHHQTVRPVSVRTIGKDITTHIANTQMCHSNSLSLKPTQQEINYLKASTIQVVPNGQQQLGLQKQRSLRVKQTNVQPASAVNSQSQRFFSKDGNQQPVKESGLVGNQLMQKHANMIQTINQISTATQNPNGQQSSSSIPKQKKTGSQSILIPRGTQAPNHKSHLDQSSRFIVKQKVPVECVQPTLLSNNFCKDYESIQSVDSTNAIQIAKPPTAPVFCASQSKTLNNSIALNQLYQHPRGAQQQDIMILQYTTQPSSIAQSIVDPRDVDQEMEVSESIQDRLNYFWNVKAPQVSENAASEIDKPDLMNPQLVSEHAEQINQMLLVNEKLHLPSPQYMQRQEDINEKMRAILVDWIIEVHLKFKLLPETLFITVSLIDRYLERVQIKRNNLQLVGVTAMLIASKYEEIYAPEVRDFVYITDNAYTKQEIFEMENQMLSTLEFNITTPSAYRFLERFVKVAQASVKQQNLARYLIELPLIEQRMLKYSPSNIAASAIYLSRKITQRNDAEWTQALTASTGYLESDLRQCAKDMCILLGGIEKCTLQAVRKKFSLQRFMEVALIKIESQGTSTCSQQSVNQ